MLDKSVLHLQEVYEGLKKRLEKRDFRVPKFRLACLPFGEKSSDIVPFNIQTSTLLADKLVEVPRDAELDRQVSLRRAETKKVITKLRHDQVLEKHKISVAEPPQLVEWLEMRDPETQKIYYHNKVTGKSVWSKPEGFDEAMEVKLRAEAARESFWIEVQDSKGRPYYYDLLTRETRWDRPANYDDAHVEDYLNSSSERYLARSSMRRTLDVQ